MQTIYAFSYNPAINTGTNTTKTVWRMAYQQPIKLYKGTANTIKIVVFNNTQQVVNLSGYDVQVQIVDQSTQEHFVTRTATNENPTSGVVSVTFTEADLRNLENRFYNIIARLMPPGDGSTVINGEILYLDDNYGAFTPVTIEDAWNYLPTSISTVDGIPEISFTNIDETPDSLDGQAQKYLRVNATEDSLEFVDIALGDLDLTAATDIIPAANNVYKLGNATNIWSNVYTHSAHISNIVIANDTISTTPEINSIKVQANRHFFTFTDLSVGENPSIGEGAIFRFDDVQHSDGPSFQTWYGNLATPYDPPGQHSLDIKAANANSYVELASHDWNNYVGVDQYGAFIFTDFQNTREKIWAFDSNGNLFLPTIGGTISSGRTDPYNDGNARVTLNNTYGVVFELRDPVDPNTIYTHQFDNTGNLNVNGSIIPTINNLYSLGSSTNWWTDLWVSNTTIHLGGIPISVDSGGNLLVDGNLVTGGGAGPTQPYVELTNDPIIFTPVYADNIVSFTKDDYATGPSTIDQIDTNMAITRANIRGIYNPYLEADWDNTNNDGPSPLNTLWNKDGWTDLTNLDQRIYLSFYETFLRFGNNVLAAEAIMYDTANNKYYKFDFTTWGNANAGAPLAYTRTRLDPVTGDPIGEPVTFTKAGYADPTLVNDPIDTNLTIARGNNQSIYNIALESAYSTAGDPEDSPEGTEWNADGWTNLRQVATRSYDTFLDTLGGQVGNNVLNKELVMHDMINDKYYAVKFNSWTQNGNGGGFSYTRQLINTSQYFTKTDYGSEVDTFIPDDGNGAGVGITRDNNGGIYNPYREGSWDSDVSPGGTLWNIDGWNDLSDIETRTYQTFYDAFGQGGLGNKVPGTECVMHLPDNGKYYLVKFFNWTQNGNGGGFSYERYELDLTKINEGIKFADGTVLKSANGIGRVKSTASRGRRIDEVSGSNTVSVTPITTVNLTTTASRSGTNTQLLWIDSTASQIDEVLNNPGAYDINDYATLQFSLDNTTWYVWGQSTSFSGNERGYSLFPATVSYNQGDTVYFRYSRGGAPQVWWDKNQLPGGAADFRGAIIDYHAYTGQATFIGTIHIVSDSGDENITHTEVSSGSSDSQNDDLWLVQNEGTISYRRMDGESKTLKIHWTAKVFYGQEFYD